MNAQRRAARAEIVRCACQLEFYLRLELEALDDGAWYAASGWREAAVRVSRDAFEVVPAACGVAS